MVVFVIMLFFMLMVFVTMVYVLYVKAVVRYYGHQKSSIETIAFCLRAAALFLMSFPSMYLLYMRGSQIHPDITVKIIGRQWYWRYEIGNNLLVEAPIYMYMLQSDELRVGSYMFMEVRNRLVLPAGYLVQFNVTSRDVIHRFAVPSLGLKVDATPGLLTCVRAHMSKIGVHYGSCMEICGMGHSYMPIVIEICPLENWWAWVNSMNTPSVEVSTSRQEETSPRVPVGVTSRSFFPTIPTSLQGWGEFVNSITLTEFVSWWVCGIICYKAGELVWYGYFGGGWL